MKALRITAAALATVGVLASGGTNVARAEDAAMKQDPQIQKMMGDNLANVQFILAALIQSNYADLPERLRSIEAHAADLTQNVPASAEADRDRFVGYAYNLRGHAADLRSIAALLVEHDAAHPAGEIVTDQLREAAAAHYGGMVTMCVTCHNSFRPLAER